MGELKRNINDSHVPPAAFAHFVLRCSDLDQSINGYQTVLGMEVVQVNNNHTTTSR
jgi:hypothetical protein